MRRSLSVAGSGLGRLWQWLVPLTAALTLACTAVSAAQSLLVTNGSGNSILSYQTSPPAPQGTFIPPATLGLLNPRGMTIGPDGNLYVVGTDLTDPNVGHVNRFNGQTGAFIERMANSGSGIFDLTWGPDTRLYVTSMTSNRVFVFDDGTGQSTFVQAGAGGLAAPRGLVFGPDGNLYVASADSDQVLRYNGKTGAFMDIFAAGIDARGLTFGPDGNLYVTDFSRDRIQKFNGLTGAFISTSFASGGGLIGPVGVVFGPDGNLYVSGFTSNNIVRYDGSTGAFIDVIGSGDGLNGPRMMVFAPLPPGPGQFQGMWWNDPASSESGWGINFAHQNDTIFATWFTFGLDGKPLWLVFGANKTAPNVYSGKLFTGTGPAFNSVPFDPSKVVPTEVGTATLTFENLWQASFAYTLNGISQTKNLTREQFSSPMPTCAWGAQPNLALATNYQDMWWASPADSESGWGINFAHQGDTIFATWFTFGLDGKPLWMVVGANKTAAKVYTGTLLTGTGPAFNAVPFDSSKVVGTPVGSATFTFFDGNEASFAYTVNGVSQTKAIVRQNFSAPGTATVCK